MKDYSALKREIQTYIRTNNNQEITGEVLQNVLVSIVSNVGENAGFGGIAKKTTSPGTPDGPVFYFATEQGVYPNFGGLEIERENTLNIIYNTEDGWDALFLGNLVPNEEVEDFRTFKHLENMRFEEASEYCATFDNIIEKIGGGAIRFSKPVIFTFSSLGTEQGMIINLPSSSRMIVQYAFTKGNANSGFSHRLIQYDLASLTITNVGEWKPISSLIPAATTSAAGLMSADDKVKLGKLDKAVVGLSYDETERDAASYKFYLEQQKADGTTEPTPVELHAATTSDAGIMSADDKKNLGNVTTAASNAQSVANAAQAKNAEQDKRLARIENNVSHLFIAGRYWDEDNATPTAAGYYGSLQALRYLPERLGLGRYLVTDGRQRKKLDPKDSTKYLDGSPAALDGSEGQCMWCWNGFYANVWHEGSRLIKAVTFDKPIGGETSVWIPAGGISWLGAGVMDRTNNILCSVINDSQQFRGGAGVALDPSKYSKAPAADSPQITMLGMPATNISMTNFGNYARKRGEGWEANWFVARFVVEFLFEIIMGTENSQEAFNANKDANGLYQGGFGTGVTDIPDWGGYNGTYPVIPTSVGLEAGDGVCLVPYSLPQTDGAEGEAYKTFNVPVFFGLVGAGFGHLWQWTRGLIMDAGEEKSLVYVTPSMYADYDPNTVADKILVAECPRVSGYIKRKSYQGLCCMPTEVGGSATIRFADYFYTNVDTSKGLRVRAAGSCADGGADAGASCTYAYSTAANANAGYSAPLCYFEEDPVISESEKIEI